MKTKYKAMFGMFVIVLFVGIVSAQISNNGDGTITISYTVSSDTAIEMKDALCANYKYQENITEIDEETGEMIDIVNPESCTLFADRQIREFVKNNIVKYRHDIAKEEARLTVAAMDDPNVE